MAPITHIVLFSFKPETPAETIQSLCDEMLSLKNKCIHPSTNKLYIISSKGGKENGVEGLGGGTTHAFIVEFESTEDRDYYALEDPRHKAFVERLQPTISGVRVADFTPGAF